MAKSTLFSAVLGCLYSLMLLQPTYAASTSSITGIAYDEGFEKILYKETHHFSDNKLLGAVNYYADNSRLIAKKQLHFAKPFCPSFQLQSNEGEFLYGLIKNGSGYYYKNGDKKTEADIFKQSAMPVICDGGFHFYMQHLVSATKKADEHQFVFGFPKRNQTLVMEIDEVSSDSFPADIHQKLMASNTDSGKPRLFRVSPASWLLGILAPTIYLAYSNHGDLLLFSGPSNLPMYDHLGRVNILYQY